MDQNLTTLFLSCMCILLMASCKKEDDCAQVCLNGGTVTESCDCACPPHTSGSSCGTVDLPASMTITRIVMEEWPYLRQNGDHWDQTTGTTAETVDESYPTCNAPWDIDLTGAPDLYITFERNGTEIGRTPTLISCLYNSTPDFILNTPITLYSLPSEHIIRLKDDDCDATDADDYIAAYSFDPSDKAQTLPTSFTISNSSTWHQTKFRLYVTWNF